MKVFTLFRQLQRLIAQGHGHKPVAVDKASLYDGNGTFDVSDVSSGTLMDVQQVDGDGHFIENKRGEIRTRWMFVLSGAKGEPT